MSKKYFIADPHFGHEKIIRYENRPFESVEQMDQLLIEKWNAIVNNEDEVYVLGDYSFYDSDKTKQITNSLKGKKYLVMGNHDEQDEVFYREVGFINAYRYPILLDNFWILSHEPVYINSNMPYANVFGHVHGSQIFADFSPQSYCVSVERINYEPIELNIIKKEITKK